MNCICDDFRFPPETVISPGLTRLPRQTGTFAEFRRALLHGVSIRTTALLEKHPLWSLRYHTERDRDGLKRSLEAIGQWRGRHPKDFGMMLLEMWAYVCDLTSFYDDVFAHESYIRTARRRDSLRKLVDPLGYIPRPAVAALAELAAFADGRRVVSLPIGTAFRSGAFSGNPPQVFELGTETKIHPLLNGWSFLPVRRATFGSTGAYHETFLCENGTVAVKEGDLVLVRVGSSRYARTVSSVAATEGADHQTYSAVTLSSSVWIPGGTPVSSVKLLKPSAKASLWNRTPGAYFPFIGPDPDPVGTMFLLESISSSFRTGQDVIVEKSGTLHPAGIIGTQIHSVEIQASSTVEIKGSGTNIIAKVPVPAVYAQTTAILTEPLPGFSVMASTIQDALEVTIHHSFVSGGKVTIEALTEVDRTDPLNVRRPVELPRDSSPPGIFQLEDANGVGLTRPGSLNFAAGHFSVQGDPWPSTLATPVKLLGNVISTSRGETVNGEFIGSGDAAIANQSFTLKKSPLTYLPAPSESTPSGLTSTLKVYVDGLQWTEVTSFYDHAPEDEVYIVRQNDKNESVITFGDGLLGRRLSTGSSVFAYYRHGGGAAMPPAGSITQIAKPFKGLKSVRDPVAPYGGADAEPADSLKKYAPRSALLLGRAISLTDLEAAAASYSGVRAVAAEWRWSSELQIPAAHIWYLADGDLTELILNKLRSLTQPDTPIQVEPAVAWAETLSIQLTHDPKRFEEDVLTAARTALMDLETGLLPPERLGIGKPLFRSRLFEFLLNLTGVTSVTGLTYGYVPFTDYGIKPPAGHYFDFSNGLYLNGRSE
jgi:hypothetical protein